MNDISDITKDPFITVSKKSFEQLKELYKKATGDNKNSFLFQEKEFLTSYAKYLIEYLEPKFK